jgi:hypothetical protein
MQRRDRTYFALIGDIVGSRQLEARAYWQRQLDEFMDELNITFAPSIASGFVVTLGDEFQALLYDATAIAGLRRELQVRALPFAVRISIGMGQVTTDTKEYAVGMDGPAFHRARAGMQHLKRTTDTLHIVTGDDAQDTLLNTIAHLTQLLKSRWTEKQEEIYRLSLQVEKQRGLAEMLNISPSAVSRMLKRMHTADIMAAENVIWRELNRLITEANN